MATKKRSIPLADTGIDWNSPVGEPELRTKTIEPAAEALPQDGMMRRYLGDTAASVARGAVQGVRMLTDTAGADNAVSGSLRSVEDFIGGLQSASAKRDQQEIARILKDAEGKGVLDQVMAGVRAFGTAPLQTMAQAAGTSIPTIAAALIPGVGPAAVAARFAAPLAMGAAQGVGTVKASNYDEVKRAALAAGDAPEVAEAKAVQAQAYGGENTGQIALQGVLGAWAGKSGLEGAAQRLAYGTGGKAVPGMVARVATGAVAEGIPEAAQGGQEKYASNSALNNAGFKTDPMSGVFANATMEWLAGNAMGGAMGIPKPGHAEAPVVDPGAAIRATKLPEGGPMTRAANAATEAQARAADSGMPPLEFTATELPTGKGDSLALADTPDTTALDFEADPRFAGAMTFDNGAAPAQPVFANKTLADIHIGEQGAMGELEAVEAGPGQWTVKQTDQAANRLARANIEQWMAKAQPMPEERARGMVKDAEAQLGKKMTALPMPDGAGWTVVPTQWVSAPILMDYVEHASAAEQAVAEQADRASKAAAEPVKRAPRTPSTDAVEIDLGGSNTVAQFIAAQAGINTPAARAFVQDYRAGRVTDADVLARVMPKKAVEPSADERIAAAAAQAPPPAAGLILNREGQPFKSERAAGIAQKKHAGSSVVVVPGGHAVQPATDAKPAAAAADTGASDVQAQAASVPAAVDPAPVEEGADPAGAGAAEAVAGGAVGPVSGAGGAVEADGLSAPTELMDKLAAGFDYQAFNAMPEGLGKTARKLGDAIMGRDAAAMADILNPSNKRSRAAFESLFSGKVKLPATIKGTRAVIDDFLSKVSAGINAAGPVATAPAQAASEVGAAAPDVSTNAGKTNTSAERVQETPGSEQVAPATPPEGAIARRNRLKAENAAPAAEPAPAASDDQREPAGSSDQQVTAERPAGRPSDLIALRKREAVLMRLKECLA